MFRQLTARVKTLFSKPPTTRFGRALHSKRAQQLLPIIAILIGVAVFLVVKPLVSSKGPVNDRQQAISQLVLSVKHGQVRRLDFNPNQLLVTVTPRNKQAKQYAVGVPGTQSIYGLQQLAEQHNVEVHSVPIAALGSKSFGQALAAALPQLLIIGLILFFVLRYVKGRGKIKVEPVTTSAVRFADIAGCDEVIEELQDIRAFLADPTTYLTIGAQIPKGILLSGGPGVGKTLCARATAAEAGVPFFSMSGSEFVEMYVGVGAKRVRELFAKAKAAAPSIVFIDELDAVGRIRSSGSGEGGSRESDQTLNQLLAEMDGFDVAASPVIVMATTNRVEMLDPALLRPGRFDRQVVVGAPDKVGRLAILQIHATGKNLAADVDLAQIAQETARMTGADLANLLNEAALHAVRRGSEAVCKLDMDDAYMRIVAGPARRTRYDETQRNKVAYHEGGHAIVSERFPAAHKVPRISIIPRGPSGGQTVYVSDEDVLLYEREELLDQICALLGGRAAEELVFGRISTGASDDLARASQMALRMVGEWGMGEAQGLLVRPQAKVAADSASEEEATAILDRQYKRALQILTDDRDLLDRIAATLLADETIDRDRFEELLAA